MKNLQQQYKSGMIFITHDLAVIAEIATKVSVMYGSYQMEIAPSETIFEKPMSRTRTLSCIVFPDSI